jgi:hypothetical protein
LICASAIRTFSPSGMLSSMEKGAAPIVEP